MRRWALPAAALGFTSLIAMVPAFARPPTVTVSPGYDRRLQDSRQQLQRVHPLAPAPVHRWHVRKRRPRD